MTNHELLKKFTKINKYNLVCLATKKKGVIRGTKKEGKQYYNDDMVLALIWTGTPYPQIIKKSSAKIDAIYKNHDSFIQSVAQEVYHMGYTDVTIQDVMDAVCELNDSLVLDDKKKRNYKTYKSKDRNKMSGLKTYQGDNPKLKDHVFLTGVQLGFKVIRPAKYHWDTKHSIKTVAKNVIKNKTPYGHYVQYSLDFLNHWGSSGLVNYRLAYGDMAIESARQMELNQDIIQSLLDPVGKKSNKIQEFVCDWGR